MAAERKAPVSDGMRTLKIATILMGVLIVLGTIGLLVALARRGAAPHASSVASAPAATTPLAVTLAEPEGTRIVSVTMVQDRLAVQLQGGGPDRVVLLDPHSGAAVGRIGLAH
jgi:hypothetical protein